MKYLSGIYLIIIILSACREETSYQLQVKFKNKTNGNLTVSLFPKEQYMRDNLYDFEEPGNDYRDTTFELAIDDEVEFYITDNLNIKPYELVMNVFDSIYIKSFNEEKPVIKFSPETVTGYKENVFSKTSEWDYEVNNFDLPTNFRRNPVESYDYLFVITNESYYKMSFPIISSYGTRYSQ